MDREKIAGQLLMENPPGNYPDYEAIVKALNQGVSKEEILSMEEVIRWPKTYRWLKEQL
ncbi:hypothetical protein [Geomesophilobacter sediminis]|uniref:Uncharacterized protein n=1 Tax=Geomesophilobacter sediminis TaxID=2798584 RepID=A0A8J7INB8_9BACT|nr:hypothetical protein [Geomesophilobacter sediminis]MBJ6724638.1 hypothetical protein [Geomesophilobacter sediminis]